MVVIHVSAECYPVAKVGGLGDVVGSLPKYQQAAGITSMVVMPYYDRQFVRESRLDVVFESEILMGGKTLPFQVLKESTDKLGYPLHLIRIPGLLDRSEIYSYPDETEQFVAFQLAFLEWLIQFGDKPNIVHCHDHQTGLIPFLMNHSFRYNQLTHIPTILTIHNAQYQGWFGWDKYHYLPDVDPWKWGMLDWEGTINSLAVGVKSCWRYTTVSPSYLEELKYNSNGLEQLFIHEEKKSLGVINGIDTEVWNPSTDPMIPCHYHSDNVSKGKQENKRAICKEFGLTLTKPLVAFIGRLVGEKGADLLPEAISNTLESLKGKVSIMVLGSGEPEIEEALAGLRTTFKKDYNVFIGYDEALSHLIYAGADFIIMPSRVEPCGLNQLYALRYGTIPVVRSTGGLKDTVIDYSQPEGYGICFEEAESEAISHAITRATELYSNTPGMRLLRKRMMSLDFSWHRSASQYIDLYNSLK
ncbi:glycogen synthase [Arcticibacter tournemirensis]|uniref:Glycogen synthase n=1 Tax=Arcticibacter tournemirensis TaxID=699437 RepID=A0A4Q0MFL1_9SPHI|nr:glycogen synthase [Arcticibacter tournemirensis]RXF71749.1 glycogen synthase [Arcticibacter tournemirensis]